MVPGTVAMCRSASPTAKSATHPNADSDPLYEDFGGNSRLLIASRLIAPRLIGPRLVAPRLVAPRRF